ncbi:MAG TPA: YhbY family RNA-binding protein [Polyangia bacterium]
MPEPTNPKKQSLMPSSPLRRKLRGAGHALATTVQVGHDGITPGVVAQVERALADHELIKVKLGSECPVDRFEAAASFAAESGVSVAQILGRTLLLYKRDPERARYE